MHELNYHHLLYFWSVARAGGVAEAARELHLTHPTISAQVRELERAVGEELFLRRGRRMELTEMGKIAYRYADEIFGLGRELVETMRGRPTGRPLRLVVGIADVVPKSVACRLLAPARAVPGGLRLVCREDKFDRLTTDLVRHELDVVLSDAPITVQTGVRAYSHVLGECGVAILAPAALAARLRRSFPQSLDGAPFLAPVEGTTLRRSLDQWFERAGIRPQIEVECQDSALLKEFARDGAGAVAVPEAIASDVAREYDLRAVGVVDSVRERFYAVTVERKIRHPAVVAICEAARDGMFQSPS